MIERRVFDEPPLKEAVLEFRFQQGEQSWDPMLVGKIHDRIEDEFPTVVGGQAPTGVSIEQRAGEMDLSVTPMGGVRRFANEDGSVTVTVGPALLGVSVLPREGESGHPGWEELRDTAFDVLGVYWDVVSPKSLARIGVRYVNHVGFQKSRKCLGDYLNADAGWLPPTLLEEERNCACRVNLQLDVERRERLQVQFEPENDDGRVVVDIDEVMEAKQKRSLDYDDLRSVCDSLHDAAYEIFVRVLRDDLLESFKPLETATRE